MKTPEKAILIVGDQKVELPIVVGTEGERAIDISRLRDQTGLITYDPSLGNTGSCQSAITYIDGEKGILRYRGIPIEQFTERPNFSRGRLAADLRAASDEAGAGGVQRPVDGATSCCTRGSSTSIQHIPVDAPPMAILSATLSNLACYHQQLLSLRGAGVVGRGRRSADQQGPHDRRLLLPPLPGAALHLPRPEAALLRNFLHMMFSIPYRQYIVTPEIEDALNLIFILHADHEQNCSTSTVRAVGSARANLFASCAAGVCALWGRLHGGANVEVVEMLERIHRGGLTRRAVRPTTPRTRDNPFKLYGFGHRVYRNFDPRAKILRDACDKVFAQLDRQDPLLDIARKLEELALKDTYFVERKLYPNVDFYSGILLRAIGIPTNMFTVCFAIGRLPGWIAQWKEQHEDATGKILRPRQIYVGPTETDYTAPGER